MSLYLFQFFRFTFFFLLLLITSDGVKGSAFCYDHIECRPDSAAWPPLCHHGIVQSPIDITVAHPSAWEAHVTATQAQPTISFNPAYKQGSNSAYLVNNGHSVQLSMTPDSTSQMLLQTNLNNGSSYIFGQAHGHWASEHTMDGEREPLEFHLVHYNSRYGNINEAASSGDPGALLIIGILYRTVSPHGQLIGDNDAIAPFLTQLDKVVSPGSGMVFIDQVAVNLYKMLGLTKVTLKEELPLFNLVGRKSFHYLDVYSYLGSLTTPGCSEPVQWLVSRNAQHISDAQLQKFCELQDSHGHNLTANYRPVQKLNGRAVTTARLYEQLRPLEQKVP